MQVMINSPPAGSAVLSLDGGCNIYQKFAFVKPLNWKHRLRELTLVLQRSVEIATQFEHQDLFIQTVKTS